MDTKSDKEIFLSRVVKDLTAKLGNDLSDIAVVLPSRRSRLFFNSYLGTLSKHPVWAPEYLTMDELFREFGNSDIGDDIKLVCELYFAYKEAYETQYHKKMEETLDEFYSFGEILLNDFEDIDKNLVQAQSLFSNLQDLNRLKDDFSHLKEEQITTISQYFKNTFLGATRLQQSFADIWEILGSVYSLFKKRLNKEGIAYQGMLMREVVERMSYACRTKYKKYAFIGFNVLSKCEEALLDALKGLSFFYWDFDLYYLDKKTKTSFEAGKYIKKNIEKYGSEIDIENEIYTEFYNKRNEKKINLVSSASESGQTAVIPKWLNSVGGFNRPTETAIILCKEEILQNVIHSLPTEKIKDINITMGYPLSHTPVFSLLKLMAELQIHGHSFEDHFKYKYVLDVLHHPYVKLIFPNSEKIMKEISEKKIFSPGKEILQNDGLFKECHDSSSLLKYFLSIIKEIGKALEGNHKNAHAYMALYRESVFRVYKMLNRLLGMVNSGDLQINRNTLVRLLMKILSSTKVPFHGEPIKGLQIMGMLETRALDFKNVLILSTNEGCIPQEDKQDSFIPQFLRKNFDLPSVEHKDSLFAYYFYRLIQRADNITFVYNSDKRQNGKPEMSRFITQLMVDPKLKIKKYELQQEIFPYQSSPIEILKDSEIIRSIKDKYLIGEGENTSILSPSALNDFIDCSLKFYFKYLKRLKTAQELDEDLDNAIFGSIFHKSIEKFYRTIGQLKDEEYKFPAFEVKTAQIELLEKRTGLIEKIVSEAFNEIYFLNKNVERSQYNGKQQINFKVICHLVKEQILFDKKNSPFYIRGLEYPIQRNIDLGNGLSIRLGGTIDRIQEKDGKLFIIDYKSGMNARTYKAISELFQSRGQRAKHVFQIFTYAFLYLDQTKSSQALVPLLLYLQSINQENYSPFIQYNKEDLLDFRNLNEEFFRSLKKKISELFDSSLPFRQTDARTLCRFCDFKEICKR